MSDESKIDRDKDSGYPKYKEIRDVGEGNHTHRFGGYSRKDQKYYEGGHGENIDEESKRESGRAFRKNRGDD